MAREKLTGENTPSRTILSEYWRLFDSGQFNGTIEDYVAELEKIKGIKIFKGQIEPSEGSTEANDGQAENIKYTVRRKVSKRPSSKLQDLAQKYGTYSDNPVIILTEENPLEEVTPAVLDFAAQITTTQISRINVSFPKSESKKHPHFELNTHDLFYKFKEIALSLYTNYLNALSTSRHLENGYFTNLLKKRTLSSAAINITLGDIKKIRSFDLMCYDKELLKNIWDLYFDNTAIFNSDTELRQLVQSLCLNTHKYVNGTTDYRKIAEKDIYNRITILSHARGIEAQEIVNKLKICEQIWEFIFINASINTTSWVYDLFLSAINVFYIDLKTAISIYERVKAHNEQES